MSKVFLQRAIPGHADVYIVNPHSIAERFVVKDYSQCITDIIYYHTARRIARTEYEVLFDMSQSKNTFPSCLQLHDKGVLLTDDRVFPLCIALPFCNGGDLFQFVTNRTNVSCWHETGDRIASNETLRSIRRFAKQMLTSLSDLHCLGWAHGDVSLENFLLHDGNIFLFDYGQAVKITDTQYRMQGKCDYHPPEFKSRPIPPIQWSAVDSYAVGVCIFAMVFGTPPSGGPAAIQCSLALIQDDTLKNIIQSLLHFNPLIRLTATNALKHKYFHELS